MRKCSFASSIVVLSVPRQAVTPCRYMDMDGMDARTCMHTSIRVSLPEAIHAVMRRS